MALSKRHKKFLFIENGLGPIISNIFINGAVIHQVFKNQAFINWETAQIDLISTAFLLPFITVILAALFIPKQIKSGKLPTLTSRKFNYPSWLPSNLFVMGLIIGIIVMALTWLVCICLPFNETSQFEHMNYVYFKAGWAGFIILFVAPTIGWWMLLKHSKRQIKS